MIRYQQNVVYKASFHFLLIIHCFLSVSVSPTFAIKESYIVYLGSHSHGKYATEADFHRATQSHHEFLGSFLGSHEKAKEAIFDSYQDTSMALLLTSKKKRLLTLQHPDVLSVFLNRKMELHTTHSWEFMDLDQNGIAVPDFLLKKARFGEDSIIAHLDTGVWPESQSFSDEGIGPIPSRWKGTCENHSGFPFRCNRKLIGARYFYKGYVSAGGKVNSTLLSARDTEGHGSHTLSTAGGNFVSGANIFGNANGTAKGGSPKARVATYKVCWQGGCYDADTLHAFDMAIHDGVDVISVSLGGNPGHYLDDSLAIGAFHAVMNGIVVLCSAGNSGPYASSVTNTAPWILTVAASTLDRKFETVVEIGNGKKFKGSSISKPMAEHKMYPLLNAGLATLPNAASNNSELCKPGTLDPGKVKGSILVCKNGLTTRLEKGLAAAEAGAVGMILYNPDPNSTLSPDPHFLPAAQILYNDSLQLLHYMNTTKKPVGYIHPPQTKFNAKPNPSVAWFSSRGPNPVTQEILKPDITAPGVKILAAFTGDTSPSDMDGDKRRVPYMLMSGTSMACPHVAGVAGLLKTLYPHWSPSAIKSAIMTTARTRDNTFHPMIAQASHNKKATPYDYGSGHIRPNAAMNPGLVYDMTVHDYLDFLCLVGYNQTQLKLASNTTHFCPKSGSILDFNYPSISVPKLYGKVSLTRRLKNVGPPGTYRATLRVPACVSMSVEPEVLKFGKVGEEKSFKMTLNVINGECVRTVFGGITWSDGKHYVRTPVVIGGISM